MCVLMAGFLHLLVFSMLFFNIKSSIPPDILSPGQSIKDGGTLVSNGQTFELGFCSPGGSSNRYLGIWYKKISTGTVVWVANRETPISDTSGVLKITEKGVLVLLNGTNEVVWSSTRETTSTPRSPIAQLLDSGNFIVTDGNDTDPENYLWQSFHFPGDTNLPGMKFGRNLVTGQDWSLTSWKSLDNPARGDYNYSIDTNGYPQSMLRKGNAIQYRGGCWNGIRFTGAPRMSTNELFRYEFVISEKEVYYKVEQLNKSVLSRLVVNASGLAGRLTWIDQTHGWYEFFQLGQDQCDNYNTCGANARCDMNAFPLCHCVEGFRPKSATEWSYRDWSGGCVRTDSLSCVEGEGFVKLMGMKLPDSSGSWFNLSMSLKECKELCLKNCSCVAYANADVRNGGSGCVLWFGDLLDMRVYSDSGQDLYVRMAKSYLENIAREEESKTAKRIGIIVCAVIVVVGIISFGLVFCARKRKQWKLRNQESIRGMLERDYNGQSQKEDLELPIFDLATIAKATDQFSIDNKLGEGGFGPVFKGVLFDGHEIAVKRLSTNSGQGLKEFKNEVVLIAKLQHRNLVRLLGCCIQRDERMLIYEYMPNKSLDYFIFDPSRRKQLDWKKRMNIIDGIARGLLYLHQDSRLRIIHRDLKTSNVLLDHNMTPKISDFGLARIFGGDQVQIETNRVVGTYGYMAPEYAADGLFSVKSDIFSFGIIVLEIVSGRRNKGFFSHHYCQNLVGHAWRLWMEDKPLELMDEALEKTCELPEIVRCIHIGLLCVQQQPEDRPNMSTVILMLGGESSLPQPKQPGYFLERSIPPETESSSSVCKSTSSYDVTISVLDPR